MIYMFRTEDFLKLAQKNYDNVTILSANYRL